MGLFRRWEVLNLRLCLTEHVAQFAVVARPRATGWPATVTDATALEVVGRGHNELILRGLGRLENPSSIHNLAPAKVNRDITTP